MNITDLTVSDLRQIERLLQRKHKLQRQVDSIDSQLLRFGGASASTDGRSRRARAGRSVRAGGGGARRKRKAGPRGSVRDKIIPLLKSAGKEGIHVKDIIKKTGLKDNNVRVWFYATGKKIKNVKQTKPATYTWVE